jgi:hypothetical protein
VAWKWIAELKKNSLRGLTLPVFFALFRARSHFFFSKGFLSFSTSHNRQKARQTRLFVGWQSVNTFPAGST